MSGDGKRLWVRALQRADHQADALSSGWRGCRRCADIDEREVIASRRGRVVERATDW
jgi:methylphosphotriester-DNA--protein-cysteine methyltransferase